MIDREFEKASTQASFTVRFLRPLAVRGQPRQRASLYGKGSVDFHSSRVTIQGKVARPFWFGRAVQIELAAAGIFNVQARGKFVLFEVLQEGTALRKFALSAASPDEAARIVSLLPSTRTEAFAQEIEERRDFEGRLSALNPRAWVTPAIVAANVLVFIAMVLNGAQFLAPDGEAAIRWGSNFGPLTVSGQWWRLFTATFIHFGVIHLALNMVALYQTGRLVERMYGSLHFLVLYVFAGLSGSILSLLTHPSTNSAGASGAIFGVFGGLLVFMLKPGSEVPKSIVVAHRNSTIAFIGFNLLNGFSHAGIDNSAHLGGLLGGMLMGMLLARPLNPEQRQNPAPRLLASTIAGAILLFGIPHWLVPRTGDTAQEMQFQRTLMVLPARETEVMRVFEATMNSAKPGPSESWAQARERVARKLEENVLPQWIEIQRSITDEKLSSKSNLLNMQNALNVYCEDRIRHIGLLVRFFREDDPELGAQALAAQKDVENQVKIIQSMAPRN